MNDKINFLPHDYLEKKSQRRTTMLCLLLFVLVAATVGGGFVVTEQRQHQVDRRALQISMEMDDARTALAKLDELENKKKEVLGQAKIIASLLEPVPRSLILAMITNNRPEGITISHYKLITKEITTDSRNSDSKTTDKNKASYAAQKKKLTQPAEETRKLQSEIEVGGVAQSDLQVAQFLANLSDSALMKQVQLSYSQETLVDDRQPREFKLTGILHTDAQASEKELEAPCHQVNAESQPKNTLNRTLGRLLGKSF